MTHKNQHNALTKGAVRIASLALACTAWAGCVDGVVVDSEHDTQPFVAGSVRLVDRDYPFAGDGGRTVCALYEYDGSDGLTYSDPEEYDFARMERRLESDPEWRRFARERAVSRVETCHDARRYAKWLTDYEDSEAAGVAGEAIALQTTEPATEPLVEEPVEDLVEKVLDSREFAYEPGLRLRIWTGGTVRQCSGFPIGPRIVVTAASCLPSTGTLPVTLASGQSSRGEDVCVHPYNGDCTARPNGNALAWRHEDWVAGDVSHDIALLWFGRAGEGPLVHSPSSWLRIGVTPMRTGEHVWVVGSGANSFGGSGSGRERLSNEAPGIDWVGSNHFFWNGEAGEGRQCVGDDGGPVVSTAVVRGRDIAVGVANAGRRARRSGESCVRGRNYSTALAGQIPWIEDRIGKCTTYQHRASVDDPWQRTFLYKRCW